MSISISQIKSAWQDQVNEFDDKNSTYHLLSPQSSGLWSAKAGDAPKTIFLSRGVEGQISLFVLGEKTLFESLPTVDCFHHDVWTDKDGKFFPALKISLPLSAANWDVLTNLVSSLGSYVESTPSVEVSALVEIISTQMASIIPRGQLLDNNALRGLFGEMHLFKYLLQLAVENSLPPDRVLAAWKGFESASRDFQRNGIAIEVKATSRDTRTHIIGSISQLTRSGEETLFVYSLSCKDDASGEDSIVSLIDDTMQLLNNNQQAILWQRLSQYGPGQLGYQKDHSTVYSRGNGFHCGTFPPGLVEISDDFGHLTPQCFQGGSPPDRVTEIQYALHFEDSDLLDQLKRNSFLLKLLN